MIHLSKITGAPPKPVMPSFEYLTSLTPVAMMAKIQLFLEEFQYNYSGKDCD